jgi:serine/threonine protein kinase
MASVSIDDRSSSSPVIDPASRYRVLWAHAKGGLGEVYLAEDSELHRRVALKEIQPEHAANAARRQRFVAEAEITGNLEHPGIVPVYGMGTYADGRPFYAMRFIRGEQFTAEIRRFHSGAVLNFSGLDFRWLLRKFTDVCNTVAYAHSRGVLHRDLKPGNIMIGPFGETLVMDWGVAKLIGRTEAVETIADDSANEPSARRCRLTWPAVG